MQTFIWSPLKDEAGKELHSQGSFLLSCNLYRQSSSACLSSDSRGYLFSHLNWEPKSESNLSKTEMSSLDPTTFLPNFSFVSVITMETPIKHSGKDLL